MPYLTITRLKLKSFKQLPAFVRGNEPSFQQLMAADGFLGGKALIDFTGGAWTLSLWRDRECIHQYYLSGEHRKLMPRLNEFACEASTRTLEWTEPRLPGWRHASRLLQQDARYSQILKEPTRDHQQQQSPLLWLPLLSRPLRPVNQIVN